MSFLVPVNYRQLPATWEMAQPFQVDTTGSNLSTQAQLNWRQPINWDPTVDYLVNDAIFYGNHGWYALLENIGVPPGTGVVDSNGNLILDSNGNPVYPWSAVPPLIPQGAIASELDPVMWARNHLLALLLTAPGERVMRPDYGVGLMNFIFEPNDPFTEQNIVTKLNMECGMYEPNITVNQCLLVPSAKWSGVFQLEIQFSVGSNPTTHTVAFSLGGTGIEVMA